MSSHLPLPSMPEPEQQPAAPVPVPSPPRKSARPSLGLTIALCVAASVFTAGLLSTLSRGGTGPTQPSSAPQVRTAVAETGDLQKTLRVGGTVETLNYAAIRAPRMRGPRDAGRAELTLVKLAEAGSVVNAGATVAEFELKWLEDHIEDRQSEVVKARSTMRKRHSEILILEETERQGRVNAKAEYDKAMLDFRKAEVLSAIEAEILKNLAEEARASWQQLEEEGRLMELVHGADLRSEELKVKEEVLHVERHQRDYTRLAVKTPIDGMVVRESRYIRGGQFAQTKEGDQIYPGTLFMRIVDVSKMVLGATVNQVDAQAIRVGDKAIVELDAYPGERFAGHVADMGAVATSAGGRSSFRRPGGGSFIKHLPVRILITDRDERILPDLSASADVFLGGLDSGVLVPREAVRQGADNGPDFVYVRQGEEYIQRPVEVKDQNNTAALIDSGLQAGEEVLLSALPVSDSGS